MEPFVAKLRQDYPGIQFVKGIQALWSPRSGQVTYEPDESAPALWTLLHELGHALLGHNSYESDTNLLHKEVVAWIKAKQLAKNYSIVISDEHIEECLDTYREWLYKRSSCPTCGNHGIQRSERLYDCLNCRDSWQVSSERFCRPYRLKKRLQ
jgi:hypothetical protein